MLRKARKSNRKRTKKQTASDRKILIIKNLKVSSKVCKIYKRRGQERFLVKQKMIKQISLNQVLGLNLSYKVLPQDRLLLPKTARENRWFVYFKQIDRAQPEITSFKKRLLSRLSWREMIYFRVIWRSRQKQTLSKSWTLKKHQKRNLAKRLWLAR